MSECNRRSFCVGAGALAGLTILDNLTGCGTGIRFMPTGTTDDDAGDDGSADAFVEGEDLMSGGGPDVDMSSQAGKADLSMASGCVAGGVKINAGSAAAVAMNSARFLSGAGYKLFVCRDAKGVFALTAVCTHAACTVGYQPGSNNFACPCHGSTYTYNGQVTMGPAFSPLVHYACCLDGSGNVIIDHSKTVSPATRL